MTSTKSPMTGNMMKRLMMQSAAKPAKSTAKKKSAGKGAMKRLGMAEMQM